MDIKEGDFVRFKAGSPLILVVGGIGSNGGNIFCSWFTANGEIQEKWLNPSTLNKVDKMEAAIEIKNTNNEFDFIMLEKE